MAVEILHVIVSNVVREEGTGGRAGRCVSK